MAAYAALNAHADSLSSQGDERSRGQIMADTMVARLTGQATAPAVPATINLGGDRPHPVQPPQHQPR